MFGSVFQNMSAYSGCMQKCRCRNAGAEMQQGNAAGKCGCDGVTETKRTCPDSQWQSLLKQTCSTMGTWLREWSILSADLLVASVRGWHGLLTQQCSLRQSNAVWLFTGETRLGSNSHFKHIDIIATIFFWKSIKRRTIKPTMCKYKKGWKYAAQKRHDCVFTTFLGFRRNKLMACVSPQTEVNIIFAKNMTDFHTAHCTIQAANCKTEDFAFKVIFAFRFWFALLTRGPVCDIARLSHHSSISPLLQRCQTLATHETGLLWLVLKDIQSISLLLQLGHKSDKGSPQEADFVSTSFTLRVSLWILLSVLSTRCARSSIISEIKRRTKDRRSKMFLCALFKLCLRPHEM